jgi:hypothetical protein
MRPNAKQARVKERVQVICASSHIAPPTHYLNVLKALRRQPVLVPAAMTMVMGVKAVTVMMIAMMMMMTDINHNLTVGRLGKRDGKGKGEQAVQKDFHTYCDSQSNVQVVIDQ